MNSTGSRKSQMTDDEYMQAALSLAANGKGFTSPNPCVGAVVVNNHRIQGQGWHHAAGRPHAEVEAINDAKGSTCGATIYVTLEPCNHFGKTPPCTHKILEAGITRVVVGCKDPNPYVSGGGIQFLREKGVEVVSGVMENEAALLIEDFIWYTRNEKRPFVTLKCAATLDGRIATATGDSKWITNETSRSFGHRLRHEADAILIGSGTLHADDPSLTCRIQGKKTRDPARIILDTRLSIREDATIINQDSHAPTIIVTGPDVPKEKRDAVTARGAKVMEVSLEAGRLDLRELMIKLGRMSVVNLLVEGGGKVAAAALKAGIVNKVCYFMAPKLLGGSDGKPVFDGKGPQKISDVFSLQHTSVEQMDSDILIKGYLK